MKIPMNNENVDQTTHRSLLGVLYFLRIPLTSKGLIIEKLREIKNESLHNLIPYKKKKEVVNFLQQNQIVVDENNIDNLSKVSINNNNNSGSVVNYVQ